MYWMIIACILVVLATLLCLLLDSSSHEFLVNALYLESCLMGALSLWLVCSSANEHGHSQAVAGEVMVVNVPSISQAFVWLHTWEVIQSRLLLWIASITIIGTTLYDSANWRDVYAPVAPEQVDKKSRRDSEADMNKINSHSLNKIIVNLQVATILGVLVSPTSQKDLCTLPSPWQKQQAKLHFLPTCAVFLTSTLACGRSCGSFPQRRIGITRAYSTNVSRRACILQLDDACT